MAYTTFPNEKVLVQANGCTLVECDALHRPGRQYVAVTRDGFRTDYPHWDGVSHVVWDNPEWFPVTFREKAGRAIFDARKEYDAFNDAAWQAEHGAGSNSPESQIEETHQTDKAFKSASRDAKPYIGTLVASLYTAEAEEEQAREESKTAALGGSEPVYAYQADTYCEPCAVKRQEGIIAAGGQDTGDSDDFPQGPYFDQESDAPEHCADCHTFLRNPLTQAGYDYVRERAADNPNGRSLQEWLDYYGNDKDLNGVPMKSSAKKAGLTCPYCKGAITPETTEKHNKCHFDAVAKGKAARSKQAAKFNFGDRVRCVWTDPYSGIREGQEGKVDVISGFKGKSVHPDPFKRLLWVKWDDGQSASVPTGNVEVISKGKGPKDVLPVALMQNGKLVKRFKTTNEAYAAAPQPWGKAYDQGYRITQMTHAEEEKAKYGSEKTAAIDVRPWRKLLDTFTKAYIEAALWSSRDESDEAQDRNYSIEDIARETIAKMKSDCEKFQTENSELLQEDNLVYQTQYSVDELGGHDFWLTRNSHGSGFWDGGWQEPAASELTKAAKSFGEFDLYVGDDGQIYGS
jgi:hypothetical protein